MHIEQFDPAAEPDKVAACYRMYAEGIPFDDPDGPPFSPSIFSSWLQEGFAGEPREVALALGPGGHPVAGPGGGRCGGADHAAAVLDRV